MPKMQKMKLVWLIVILFSLSYVYAVDYLIPPELTGSAGVTSANWTLHTTDEIADGMFHKKSGSTYNANPSRYRNQINETFAGIAQNFSFCFQANMTGGNDFGIAFSAGNTSTPFADANRMFEFRGNNPQTTINNWTFGGDVFNTATGNAFDLGLSADSTMINFTVFFNRTIGGKQHANVFVNGTFRGNTSTGSTLPDTWSSFVMASDTLGQVYWVANVSAINSTTPNIGCIATNTAPADTTPPTINITNQNASDTIKINNRLNITAVISGTATTANFTFNLTGNSNLYNFTFPSLTGATQTLSQNITVNLTRGNVINITVASCDASSNCAENSTTITISNTAPPVTSITNGSDKNVNTNITLNITGITDDDKDTIFYAVRFEAVNPPTVVIANYTSLNFTTNMTNETTYFIRIDTHDGVVTTIGTTIFNVTLDVTTPIWQQGFISNGSFYRTSTNITYNCTDNNLFEVNTTFSRTSGAIINSNNFINLTTSGGSKTINLSIDTSAGDGVYNITRWCGDSKNKKRPMREWNVATSTDNRSLQFNNSATGLQCNISYGTTNPAEKMFLPLQANVSLKMSISYVDDDFYKISYNVVAPNTGFTSATEFICNQKITQVDDNLAGHLLLGTGKDKLSYDAQDLIDAGFTVNTTIDSDNNFMQVIKKSGIVAGAVVSYDPRADNLNIVENSAIIEVDTTLPQFFSLNISLNGLLANNSAVNINNINFTYNVSDKNNNTILFYVNNTINITTGYKSNISQNATIRFEQGTYNIILEISDNATNKLNSSPYGFTVDTTIPIVNIQLPVNATTLSHDINAPITFRFNASKTSKCSLVFDNSIIATNDSTTSSLTNILAFFSQVEGTFTYFVNCTDAALNKANQTNVIIFTKPLIFGGSSSSVSGGGGGGGGGTSVFSITPNIISNATSNSTSSIIPKSITILNATHIKVIYSDNTSREIQIFADLSTNNKFLDIAFPLPSFMQFTIEQLQPETANSLKYFAAMSYTSKETLSQNTRITGIRILTPITLLSIILFIYIIKLLRKL